MLRNYDDLALPDCEPVAYTLEFRCPKCHSEQVDIDGSSEVPDFCDGWPSTGDELRMWCCSACSHRAVGSSFIVRRIEGVSSQAKNPFVSESGPGRLRRQPLAQANPLPVILDRTFGITMHHPATIRSVQQIRADNQNPLPEGPGVYAFWWIGDRTRLLNANRKVVLKGPSEQPVKVEYGDWWPHDLAYPCLYVGKSTNIRKRFGQHLKMGSPGRLHVAHPEHHKAKPHTTSCQLRWGIEHVFPGESDPLSLISTSVGFSYRTDFPDNAIAERFFEEDRLVGTWRPWFNIDSER